MKRQKASDIVDKPEDSTVQVPRQTRKRQPKVDKERVSGAVDDIGSKVLQSEYYETGQRASRRLAYKPPQFGMFAEQGTSTSKPIPLGPHNRVLPKKKLIAAKGTKS